jgi:hypothetical protein
MDQYYQPIYKQAAAMQHQFHDYSLSMAHDPSAMLLRNEIHKLTDDLASSRNPRTIENRLHVIENQLRQTEINNLSRPTQTAIMKYDHSNQLVSNLEQMRLAVRQHPHY